MIDDRSITGTPQSVISSLIATLSASTRVDHFAGFKIGITGDPAGRWSVHAVEYDDMILLYRTNDPEQVREVERDLVSYNWFVTDNTVGGGGGNLSSAPYYLYVVRRRQ